METPQVRPGLVKAGESLPRVVAFFHNSALGNLAIQLLMQVGVPNDRLGVTPPEQIEGGPGHGPVDRLPGREIARQGRGDLPDARGQDPPPARLIVAR